MEVILKEDVINLGYKDDIVTVKNGYGRNFLIPQGKAIMATESAKKMLAEDLKQRAHKIAAIKKEAEDRAKKFEGVSITIEAKTDVDGNLFGSVSSHQIVEALEKLGHSVDRKLIVVKGIKVVGKHSATIRLHKEVVVELPFEVVSENHKVLNTATSKGDDTSKDA